MRECPFLAHFWPANKDCTMLILGILVILEFLQGLTTVLGEKIRSKMQVFLKVDNAALGKMSFHLCNLSTGSWGSVA